MAQPRNAHDPTTASSWNEMYPAGIVILAALGIVAALYLSAGFLVPIALAIVLSALLRPLVRAQQRARVPAGVGAALVVLAFVLLIVAAGFALVTPMRGWFAQAPQTFAAAKAKLNRLREPIQNLTGAAEQLTGGPAEPTPAPAAQPNDQGPSGGAPPSPPPQPAPISGGLPKILASVLGTTTQILGGAAEVLLLMYLILASGGMFHRKFVRELPGPRDKQVADDVVDQAEKVILRYVIVNALVNFGQAIAVTLVLWWLGMPSPILWGLFTFVLEFIPYIGAAIMIALLTLTATATFDSVGRVLLVPGSYLLISTLQNSLVSPLAYGRGLQLNPVAVFIGVLFWWYVWGVVGAFLAVPILAVIKIAADRTERFRPVGEFLGE